MKARITVVVTYDYELRPEMYDPTWTTAQCVDHDTTIVRENPEVLLENGLAQVCVDGVVLEES